MEKQYTVYIHRNIINNKHYVGLTRQKPEERWRHDGFGYKSQIKFWNAIQKYGWSNFEHLIIATNLTEQEASELEQQLIKSLNSIKNGYNISPGGSTTNHSQETLEKMRQSMLGKTHTEETKIKISQAKEKDKKPVKCIETGIIYESGSYAAKMTGIDKSSISKCCQGQIYSAGGYNWQYVNKELSNKYALTKQMNINKAKKPIKCLTTGKVYESVTAAAKDTNSDASNITKVCNGKYKTTNNLKWCFITYEEYLMEQ